MMQMKVGQCRVGMVMTNCYGLLNTQTKEMILVDPGDSPEVIGRMVEELEGKPVAIFLTHGHYDHILALEAVKEKYQIPVYASKEEEELLGDVSLNLTGQVRRPMTVRPETLVSDPHAGSYKGQRLLLFSGGKPPRQRGYAVPRIRGADRPAHREYGADDGELKTSAGDIAGGDGRAPWP